MNEQLLGNWVGTNLLNLSWLPNPIYSSAATLTVTKAVTDHFFEFAYTWSHDDMPQRGVLLVGTNPKSGVATAAWCDSWHQSSGLMFCTGALGADGELSVVGTYEAPPGPDWSWRTVIRLTDTNTLELSMVNIAPNGDEEWAVRATFQRS